MVPYIPVFVGALAAAEAEREREREEEEEMTHYSGKELSDDWEFKILRSSFKDPAKLRAILEEETRGGWILVEKFDDTRIRLKRPAGAKEAQGDFADGYDPYRTTVPSGAAAQIMATIIIGAVGLLLLTGFLLFVLRGVAFR